MTIQEKLLKGYLKVREALNDRPAANAVAVQVYENKKVTVWVQIRRKTETPSFHGSVVGSMEEH